VKTYKSIALSATVAFSLTFITFLAAVGTPDRSTFGEVVLRFSAVMMVLSLAVLVISTLIVAVSEEDR
jgi:hypothetical protein